MTITEADRHRLHQALVNQLGEAEAATLMEHLPPTGWADVATKTDLAHLQSAVDTRFEAVGTRFDHFQAATTAEINHLRAEMNSRFDHSQEVVDERFNTFGATMDARFAAMDAKLEAGFNRHLRWIISTMIASYAVFATLAAVATFVR